MKFNRRIAGIMTMNRTATYLLKVLLLASTVTSDVACKKQPDPISTSTTTTGVESKPVEPDAEQDPALKDLVFDKTIAIDEARLPKPPTVAPHDVTVRYLLVKYKGAKDADDARWTRDEAKRRAERLAAIARQKGADIAALAQTYSEVLPSMRGKPELFHRGSSESAFEHAAFQLGPGHVSDPVETSFGYYVIERVLSEEYSTAHVLIMYRGATNAPPAFKRTKEEARKLAEKVRQRAIEGKEAFSVLASRNSDSPSGRLRGGVIAPIGPARLPKGLEPYLDAVRQLAEGAISKVIETEYGFHVIKRLPLERVMVRHIVIGFNGAETKPKSSRTKGQAKVLAEKVYQLTQAKDADFSSLVKEYSEDTLAGEGGLLPTFSRGEMIPRFEQFAFGLRKGEVSHPVETKLGFHIIKREQ